MEYIQNGLDFYRSDFAWASDEIYDLVDAFHCRDKLKDDTPEEVLRQKLSSDVKLIAQECPNLKKLDMSLFGEKTYLYANDDEIWRPFAEGLPKLVSMTLIGKLNLKFRILTLDGASMFRTSLVFPSPNGAF